MDDNNILCFKDMENASHVLDPIIFADYTNVFFTYSDIQTSQY